MTLRSHSVGDLSIHQACILRKMVTSLRSEGPRAWRNAFHHRWALPINSKLLAIRSAKVAWLDAASTISFALCKVSELKIWICSRRQVGIVWLNDWCALKYAVKAGISIWWLLWHRMFLSARRPHNVETSTATGLDAHFFSWHHVWLSDNYIRLPLVNKFERFYWLNWEVDALGKLLLSNIIHI